MKKLKWTLQPANELSLRQDEWARLNAGAHNHALLNPAFLISCIEHFADTDTYLAIGQDRSGTVAAMALLRRINLFTWSTFSPSQLPVAPIVAKVDYSIESIATELIEYLPWPTQMLSLEHLDPALFSPPADLRKIITLPYIETCEIVVPDTDWHAYFNSLTTSLVGNIRRRRNKAARDLGEVTLEVVTAKTDIDYAVNTYADLESLGWKSSAGTALRRGDTQTSFYAELLARLCEQGKGAALILRFGDVVAAARLLIWDDLRVVMLKTAFNEELRAYAPGQILFYDTLTWLAENHPHLTRVETYGPANELQRSFSTGIRQLYHANTYRTNALRTLHAWKMQRSSRNQADDTRTLEQPSLQKNDHSAISVAASLSDIPPSPQSQTNLFSTRDWFEIYAENVLDVTGTPVLLPYVSDRDGNGLCLPLIVKGTRALSASNYYSGLYAPIELGAGFDAATFSKMLVPWIRNQKIGFLRLYPVDQSDPLVSNLEDGLRKRGYWVDRYFAFANWYLPCANMRYADYFAGRPSKLRNSIRRAQKALSRIKDHETEIVTHENDSLERAISDYCSVYAHSWKQAEPYPEFIPNLCRMAAKKGWLRLGIVRLQGTPVAAQIWIVTGGTAYIYKLAYDEQYARMGVGTVLQAALSEYVLERDKVSKIDFLSGDESYKADWMSHRQERVGLIAFHPLTISGLFSAIPHYLGKVWRHFVAKYQATTTVHNASTPRRDTHHD